MTKIIEWTESQEKEWAQWVSTRPASVQKICERIRPGTLYMLKTTGQRVFILASSEGGTVRVAVTQEYNPKLIFEREVFGIDPNDLEECDLPTAQEFTAGVQ